jgi:hypothetical protein
MDAVRPENHSSDKARERDRPHFAASLSTSPEPFVKRRARQVELVGYTGSKAARFQSDAEKSQNVEPRPSNQDLRTKTSEREAEGGGTPRANASKALTRAAKFPSLHF